MSGLEDLIRIFDRFEAKFEIGPVSLRRGAYGPCWIWTASLKPAGYGQFRLNGKTVYAHRLAYHLYVGPLSRRKELDHLCRVRRCVSPLHLEPVTHAENVRRGDARRAARQHWESRTHCVNGHSHVEHRAWSEAQQRHLCRECKRERGRRAYRKARAA